MKYRETDAKSYRPSAVNLSPVEEGAATAPPPERKRPRAEVSKQKTPSLGGGAVEIWTDGACSGNPGPMGIGVVVIDGGERREKGEYLGVGTNNIAELTAIERGIDLAGGGGRRMRVYTDSSYAIGVLSKGWKAKANQELIGRLRRQLAPLDVEFVKVAGHAGVPENERCDELARDAVNGRSR
ncbi:MAG TPA: ribonuclease H [Polyangia bacterium]|nr:ribonuclease H [Polyangia bacterium]